MKQTYLDSLIRNIANRLHGRGCEVTPDEVARWLGMMAQKFQRGTRQQVDEERIATALVIGRNRELTKYLHTHFGVAESGKET